MRDTYCGTCAYRVNERVVRDAAIAFEMVCLHPSVHREACSDARDSRGPCGPDALKWKRKDMTPNGEVRGASRPAGEASSREAATSTVVLDLNTKGQQ